MSFNTFGTLFSVTTFGESHGEVIGAVVDGCPGNIELDLALIQQQLNRRRPGITEAGSPRKEADQFRIVSGLFEGKTTGAPITILIENKDVKSVDYDSVKKFYRPSHADFVYDQKYGNYDYRGGGRSSARTTAPVVAAGAIAQQIIRRHGIRVLSYVTAIGAIRMSKSPEELDLTVIDESAVRCPDQSTAVLMENLIHETKMRGDSLGGIIRCIVKGTPVGLGEPLFQKLNANIAQAMFSINAVKGVAFGDGFDGAQSFGSLQNDPFEKTGEVWRTTTNHSGGIQGGISNGMDIVFDVAFKPVSTIMQSQVTADKEGVQGTLNPSGRHDTCVVPRAIPIVDAFTALVLVNHLLIHRAGKDI